MGWAGDTGFFTAPPNVTEEGCLALIRTGGKAGDAGFRGLYDLMGQRLLRFFAVRGLSADEGKDAMQETMVRIVRGVDGFAGQGTAAGWVWQIARNCLAEHYRKKKSRQETPYTDDDRQRLYGGGQMGANTTPAIEEDISWETLYPDYDRQSPLKDKEASDVFEVNPPNPLYQNADDCLTKGLGNFRAVAPERAHVLELQMEGCSIEDIAAVIGRTPGATKEYLCQCRKKLEPYVSHCRDLLES